jgi:two-component system KDP operon response regulator KdpE
MTEVPLILAVDDEPGVLRLIDLELSSQGFRVITATNGDDALAAVQQHRPQVLVLDVVLPGLDGLTVMAELKRQVPVILLTGRDRDRDKIRGLDLGADDYVAKPFIPEELSARVRAILRRALPAEERTRIVTFGDIEIDLDGRLVRKSGSIVALTKTEWQLLQFLTESAGKISTNRELLTKVWGRECANDNAYLRVWVARLRAKLEDDPAKPAIIRTRPCVGYYLDAGDLESAPREKLGWSEENLRDRESEEPAQFSLAAT